ncbi:hypothetical protein MLD38_017572 [Melastoma candidum]|uniref:Uncharacterized protein n=1 Tax=Melastoma candidum TaxID=119954 RepID=A0ACB9QS66_9MYRT|nr:hypothetical protein MLD38_017572 [Melastoma candidum]
MARFPALLAGLLLLAAAGTSTAELLRVQHRPKDEGSLAFLVIGDWGRKGSHNQSEVADQMGIVGERIGSEFVISTGDNFYENGLTGTDDPAFYQSFVDIYNAPGLQTTWYNVLGNHDYRGDVEAQLSPILRAKDSRWVCFRSAVLNTGLAHFFFVDTTPFEDKYFTHPGKDTYDWSGVLPRDKYLSDLKKDLDLALKESTATWKIVVGHHTIKSMGEHGTTVELMDQIVPILEENKVDFYINGHDHCLQHITSIDSKIQYITSGGGSAAWRGNIKPWSRPEEMKFYYDGQGFLSVQMTKDEASFVFYDVFGEVLYKWAVTKVAKLYSDA